MNPTLAPFLRQRFPDLTIRSLILGAAPVAEKSVEPWRNLPMLLPGSEIFGVDADGGNRFDADIARAVVGWPEGPAVYHETAAPMCGSLYAPDHAVLDRYVGLEVARETGTHAVDVIALDDFTEGMRPVHFIQADIQGAEADAFCGGKETLGACLAVVAEVEFVPLYRDQPLFGNVDEVLRADGFEFHTFLGFAARPLHCSLERSRAKPAPWPQQILWADAIWYRRPEKSVRNCNHSNENLARLAILADLYGHRDLACLALERIDPAFGEAYAENAMELKEIAHGP